MPRSYSKKRPPRRREPVSLKPSIITASIVTVVLLGLALLTGGLESAPNWTLFLGRFHPAILHLFIGFFVILAILEFMDSSKNGPRIGKACQIVLDLTAYVAAIGAVLGILLALPGGYNESLIDRHRWLGCLAAIFAFWLIVLRTWARSKRRNGFSLPYHGALAAAILFFIVVGNDGSTLTHGSGYLSRYLTSPTANMLGKEGSDDENRPITVAEADVYQDLIHPIFEQNCVQCHGPDKVKGELRLDSFELAMQGGELGDTIVPGDIDASELIYRLHLEIDDDEHMPPEGKPQPTDGQVAILEWWIQSGAMASGLVGELEVPENVKAAMVAQLDSDAEEEAVEEVPEITVPMLTWEEIAPEIATLEEEPNIDILRVALNSPAVRVKGPFGDEKFNDEALGKLDPIANNIIELEIGFSDVTDKGLAAVASMPNLEKLYLQKTAVTDEGLAHLAGLTQLRYLNLYGTQVTDAAFDHLMGLPKLKSLFLWETDVSKEAAHDFQERKLASTGVETWQAEIDALKAKIADAKILVDTGIEAEE